MSALSGTSSLAAAADALEAIARDLPAEVAPSRSWEDEPAHSRRRRGRRRSGGHRGTVVTAGGGSVPIARPGGPSRRRFDAAPALVVALADPHDQGNADLQPPRRWRRCGLLAASEVWTPAAVGCRLRWSTGTGRRRRAPHGEPVPRSRSTWSVGPRSIARARVIAGLPVRRSSKRCGATLTVPTPGHHVARWSARGPRRGG